LFQSYDVVQAGKSCLDDLEELDALRSRTLEEISMIEGTEEIFAQYYGNLCLIEKRFPVTQYEGDVNVCFSWADAFQPDQVVEMHKIGLEKAATVFNLGAYFSQMGINIEKETVDDLAVAGKYFMKAAGCLSYVKSEIIPSLIRTSMVSTTLDLSIECLEMLEGIMVTQAIECILEKGRQGGTGKGTLARISQQVSALYNGTYQILCGKEMKEHFERPWRYTFKVKSLYYAAMSYMYQAEYLRAKLEHVDIRDAIKSQLGYMQEAKSVIHEAQRHFSNIKYNVKLKEEIDRLAKDIGLTLAEHQKENMSTYLLRVPSMSELEQIEPLSADALPKCIIPDYLKEPISSIRFSGIVPEEVTRDWSKYTDMLDRMLREQTSRIDMASDNARMKLREMELPERLHAMQIGHVDNIPEGVKVDLESIQASGGLSSMLDIAQQLTDMNFSVSKDLDECRTALNASRAKGMSQEMYDLYNNKIESYSNNLVVAKKTDGTINDRIEKHRKDLKTLELRNAAADAPSVQSPMLLMDSTEPAEAAHALKVGLQGLQALSTQRASLEESLQQQKNNDDIVESLMNSNSQKGEIFQAHLAKYDGIKKSIEANITKQEEILTAMKHANKIFVDSYDFDDWEKKRRSMAVRWKDKIETFKSIQSCLHEGMEFYVTLSDAVNSMKNDLCKDDSSGRNCLPQISRMTIKEDDVQGELVSGVNPLFNRR
jgi:programmed cell death 6-interacting protein